MSTVKYQIEKNARRAQFEADKLRRAGKVRSEVDRARRDIKAHTDSLGHKALEIAAAGETLPGPLQEIIDKILALREDIAKREEQIALIKAEPWVPPPPPPPPPPRPPKPAARLEPPKPAPKAPLARGEQVKSRLQFYIETEDTMRKCPNCHAVLEEDAPVCKQCGFRPGS